MLVASDYSCKISDFGLSRELKDVTTLVSSCFYVLMLFDFDSLVVLYSVYLFVDCRVLLRGL